LSKIPLLVISFALNIALEFGLDPKGQETFLPQSSILPRGG